MSDISDGENSFNITIGYLLDLASQRKVSLSIDGIKKKLDDMEETKLKIKLDMDDADKDKLTKWFEGTQLGNNLLGYAKQFAKMLKDAWVDGIEKPMADLMTGNKAGVSNLTILGFSNAASKLGVKGDVTSDLVKLAQEMASLRYVGDLNSSRAIAVSQLGGSEEAAIKLPPEQRVQYLVDLASKAFAANANNPKALANVWNRVADELSPALADLVMRVAGSPTSNLMAGTSAYNYIVDFGVGSESAARIQENLRQADINSKVMADAMANIGTSLTALKMDVLTSEPVSAAIASFAAAVDTDAKKAVRGKRDRTPEEQVAILQAQKALADVAMSFLGNDAVGGGLFGLGVTKGGKAARSLSKGDDAWLYQTLGITSSSNRAWLDDKIFSDRRETLGAYVDQSNFSGAQKYMWDIVMSSMSQNMPDASKYLQLMLKEVMSRLAEANPEASEEDMQKVLSGYILNLGGGQKFFDFPSFWAAYPESGQSQANWSNPNTNIFRKRDTQEEYIQKLHDAYEQQLKLTVGNTVGVLNSTLRIDLTVNGSSAASVSMAQGSSKAIAPAPINLNNLGALNG